MALFLAFAFLLRVGCTGTMRYSILYWCFSAISQTTLPLIYAKQHTVQEVEEGLMDVPRWSHATFAVQSIPNWKIFVFGGIGGEITDANRQGTFMNDVCIFDTGTERWMHPDVQGDPPLPRGETQLEYYQQAR